ncbi:MAG: hypothetical protein H6Q00_311 [Holophagaceae bacterium]|nr:hypothetical protein [Holophagaceae bacterium]
MKQSLLSLGLVVGLAAPLAAQGAHLIKRGEVFRWSVKGGQSGMMKIVSVDGPLFEVEQTNEMNRAAGVVRLYGAVVNNGRKVVLLNVGQWKEVWEGNLLDDEIAGDLRTGSANLTFRMAPAGRERPREADTAPFLTGRTLRWETGAAGGQNGTLYVTHTRGASFFLEQKNDRNTAAGIVRLEGEVKDGQIFIYNRKWHETWVGVYRHGRVIGKINNQSEFRIFE